MAIVITVVRGERAMNLVGMAIINPQTLELKPVFKSCMLSTELMGLRLNVTLSQTTHFNLFQTERVCRRQFDKSVRKFSRRVENTVGKGEIARDEQFLLFPLCFQKTCSADM